MQSSRPRRGAALLWSVAALALAMALTPLYVSLCHSLSRLTARNGHRLVAVQRGQAELERVRAVAPAPRSFAVSELPAGQGTLTLRPSASPGLLEARLLITWQENGAPARAEWTTLIREAGL